LLRQRYQVQLVFFFVRFHVINVHHLLQIVKHFCSTFIDYFLG